MMRFTTLVLLSGSLLLCACVDHTKQTEARMKSESTQKITALSEADQERLQDQRAVIEKFLTDETSRKKYQTAAGKLGTIRFILDKNLFKPTQTYELQCLGIVLGDAFVQDLKMEWVTVEDEHGRDPAVRLPKTSIILFPLTMISCASSVVKRLTSSTYSMAWPQKCKKCNDRAIRQLRSGAPGAEFAPGAVGLSAQKPEQDSSGEV